MKNNKYLTLQGHPKAKEEQLRNAVDDEQIPDTGKCNNDSKDLPNVNSIPESPICNLADIVMGRRVLSTLSDVEKYQYLAKHHCSTD